MQALAPALFLVMLELTVGSFISLYFLDLRGDSSRGFIIFQGVLYLTFAGLTLLAMNAFATPTLLHGFGLDQPWLQAQGPFVLAFSLLMIPWNVLLWRDRSPRPTRGKPAATEPGTLASGLRRARFALGGLTALVGAAALFTVGMAYRTLADARLNGALVVLVLVAGGIALGGVMTAMLLGHWYLNTPTASGKPLEFATTLMLVALVAEIAFTLFLGPSTAHSTLPTSTVAPGTTIQVTDKGLQISTPTVQAGQPGQAVQPAPVQQVRSAPLTTGAMVWMQFLMGFLAPLVLGVIALVLTRGRSFQSATGMLYLCVSFLFIGEIIGRGLLLSPLFY